MKVSEILAKKSDALVTIKPSDRVTDLSRLLRDRRVGAAVVSEDGVAIDGFVSERDVAYSLCLYNAKIFETQVSEIMSRKVVTCAPDDDIAVVASAMQAHHIRHIPVVEGNRACGMVSIRDLLNVRVDALQREAALLRTLARSRNEPQDR